MADNTCITVEQQQQLFDTTNKINDLVSQASQTISCGPSCQKQNVANQLQQKYLDSENAVSTGQQRLDENRKNYYVFTQGRTSYETMLEGELQQKAQDISNEISAQFMKLIQQAKLYNTYYNTEILNLQNTTELYNEHKYKNNEYEEVIKKNHGDILTNDRKSFYEIQEQDNLQYWYFVYLWVYRILLFLFLIGLLFINTSISLFQRIILFVVLLIYPTIIHPLLQYLYSFIKKGSHYLPKNVYTTL